MFKYLFLLLTINVSARNILLIITDDMTSTIFDEYPSHSFFESANIFNAISSQPVCGPSRASLLTGRRPDSTQIYNFETYLHQPTIFSYFKNLGYDTFVTGKVFHTLPIDQTKQFEYEINELSNPRVCLDMGNNGCKNNEFSCNVKTSQDACSMFAIQNFFMSKIGVTSSWIAGVGFHRPHLELTIASKGHSNLCKTFVNDINFQTPLNFQTNQTTNFLYSLNNIQHTDLMYMKVPINHVSTRLNANGRIYPHNFFVSKYANAVQQMRQAYCDSSTETINYFLDIVDLLYKILPEAINNTDIIFIADHGFQIGQRTILGKNTLYPESTNIPLFLKIAGENTKRPIKTNYVSSIDIFPTLIQLHKPTSSLRNVIPNIDGISILDSGQIPISQYPRCQSLGTIQTNDCTVGFDSCLTSVGRLPISYMGYMTIEEINGGVYRFSEWFPFNEVRKCGWPWWPEIPTQFVNNLGPWPVWNIQPESSTIFSSQPIFKELYTIDQNTQLINSENLINEILYANIIDQLDQVIRNNA